VFIASVVAAVPTTLLSRFWAYAFAVSSHRMSEHSVQLHFAHSRYRPSRNMSWVSWINLLSLRALCCSGTQDKEKGALMIDDSSMVQNEQWSNTATMLPLLLLLFE
jgi:hypothetical protein